MKKLTLNSGLRVIAVFVAALLMSMPAQAIKLSKKELMAKWDGRRFFLCCNVWYDDDEISDANYHRGQIIPYGTPVTIIKVRKDLVFFDTGRERLAIEFGFNEDRMFIDDYAHMLLKENDPRAVSRNVDVQAAIDEGRVEVGMTRDEVLIAIGIPPAHHTPSLRDRTWKFWINRRNTFTVDFGADGKVERINGPAALTRNKPVRDNETSIKRELE